MEKKLLEYNRVIEESKVLIGLFDIVRIIDHRSSQCNEISAGREQLIENSCFSRIKKGISCENCISYRAYSEKETYVKLEYSEGIIYMVMAVPVRKGNDTVVLELIRDITGSIMVDRLEGYDNNSLIKLINDINALQVKDGLTGIYNRRFIDQRLPLDLSDTTRCRSALSLILADIDHFKKVNDTYGHLAGDHVLKEFASLLDKGISAYNGWAGRYGGEEFLLVLRGMDGENALNVAEELRKKTEALEINFSDQLISITASFGVHILKEPYDEPLERLLQVTDDNLYRAKASGRNRVVSDIIE